MVEIAILEVDDPLALALEIELEDSLVTYYF